MKSILNFIITGLILWTSSKLFPEVVMIYSSSVLIVATLLLFLIRVAVMVFLVLFVLATIRYLNPFVLFAIVALVAASVNLIGITALSNHLDGFNVIGLWPKILLSLCIAIFTISDNNPKRE